MMRFAKVGIIVVCMLLMVFSLPAFGKTPKPRDVQMPGTMIASGGVGAGSTSTLIVLWVVKRINALYPDIAIRHIPGGNKDGIVKASKGTVDIGKSEVGICKRAWNGLPPEFKDKPLRDARLITCVPTPTCITIATLKHREDIKTSKDLWNKRCGVGMATSITHVLATAALGAYGISPKSIKANGGLWSYGKWSNQFDMLAQGTVDCVIFGTPQPYSSAITVDMAPRKGIKLIPWGDEGLAASQKAFPDNPIRIVPANVYSGQPESVKAFGTRNLLAVHKKMPKDVVYNILYALFKDDGASYREIAATFKDLDVLAESLLSEPIPWHPGAVEYFRDRGTMK